MTETEELNALYEAALKAGKCHNKGQFADLVRKDRTGISSAMNGKRMSDNLMTDVRERLAAQGIFSITHSELLTSSLTGHSGNTKVFGRYAQVDDDMKREIINNLTHGNGTE